jgi:hypothetical protein
MRNEEISGVGPREGGWSQPGGCWKRTEAEQATGIGWSASIERTERPASRVWVGRCRRRSKPAVAEEMAGVVAGGSRVRACDADGDAGRSRMGGHRIWWSAGVGRRERPAGRVGGQASEAEQATSGEGDGRRAGGGRVCTRAVEICLGQAAAAVAGCRWRRRRWQWRAAVVAMAGCNGCGGG